jgi:hypothetical protein
MKYYSTDIEVELGDRVIYKHMLFGKSKGIVAYLPGISELNSRIEFNGSQQWVVKLDNGKGVFMVFCAELEYAHRRIQFLSRGATNGLIQSSDVI